MSYKDDDAKQTQYYRDQFTHFYAPLLFVRLLDDPGFVPTSRDRKMVSPDVRSGKRRRARGLRSRAHPAVGADLKPRWLDHPVSYCFSLARRVQLLILPFQLTFRRGRRIRSGESGGPPLFEPSLKVERDTAHHQNSGFGRPGLKFLNWRSQPGRYPLRRMGLADDLIDVIAIDAVKRAQVESDPRGLDAYQDHRA